MKRRKSWEAITPEELAEREKKKRPSANQALAMQWEWAWGESARKLRGTNRDPVKKR